MLHMLLRHLPERASDLSRDRLSLRGADCIPRPHGPRVGAEPRKCASTTTVQEFEAQFGKLHIVQPTACCQARKVEPLMRSLEPFDWWFTGLRREQSPTRAGLKKVEDHRLPSGQAAKKDERAGRLGLGSRDGVRAREGIPQLELYARGYTSIGCEPCTAIPEAGADARSGRWGGKKLECGIHTFSERS